MTEVTRVGLSSSDDGEMVVVVATATVGTTIHTATTQTSTSRYDEVWLFASNSHSAAVDLTMEIDIANSSTSKFKVSIPKDDGLFVVLPGVSIHNGKKITAFASVASVINVVGYVEQHI